MRTGAVKSYNLMAARGFRPLACPRENRLYRKAFTPLQCQVEGWRWVAIGSHEIARLHLRGASGVLPSLSLAA